MTAPDRKSPAFIRILKIERELLRCLDRETWFDLKHQYMEAWDDMEREAEANEIIAGLRPAPMEKAA